MKQRFSYINYFRFSLSVVRLAFLLFLMSVKPVQSQQVDSIGADSARIKVLERLEVLARPPGIDSTLFVADSLLSSSRPIEVGSSFSPDSFLNQLLTLPEYS